MHISSAIARFAKDAMKNNEFLIVKLIESEDTTVAVRLQEDFDQKEFERNTF